MNGSFGRFVALAHDAGELVVQPRMGMSDPHMMRAGLLATKHASATTVGTITLDSYTRVGEHDATLNALAAGVGLNGYPIVAHPIATTRAVLDGVLDSGFPVQVRHGSARPQDIVTALVAAGLAATEGGPVSYCLPYGRVPLAESVRNWARSCETLAESEGAHLETFGGCLMGQLCPPSLLVAMSVLEAMFFQQHGLASVSLSYAQQTCPGQDEEAVFALRRLAGELLPDLDWHVVIYAYMGRYPRTPDGALGVLRQAARLAVRTGSERLIVKTVAEAHRIPTIEENVAALEAAAEVPVVPPAGAVEDTGIHSEARTLVEAVLNLGSDVGRALVRAFAAGYLDVPYCLHPDNEGKSRSRIDAQGRLRWTSAGRMPITVAARASELSAAGLLDSLSYMEKKFDQPVRVPAAEKTTVTRQATKFSQDHAGPPGSRTAERWGALGVR